LFHFCASIYKPILVNST